MADAFLRDPVVLTPRQALEQLPDHAADQLRVGQAPETLIVVHAEPLFELVCDSLEASATRARVGPAELQVSEAYEGIGVTQPGTGASAVALVVEKCIAAGTRRVLSLGFAGAIAPNAEPGEVCLVTEALAYDGVTSHYAGPGYQPTPDRGLTRTLAEAVPSATTGAVWTTAAPYRETVEAVDRHRKEGVLAVDMETSAVLTVAAYRKVPAAAMLVTADVLRGHDWHPCPEGAADEAVRDAVRGLVGLCKGLRNLS